MKSQLLTIALLAVKEAEEVILNYLDQNVRSELKADLSPVAVADREAEKGQGCFLNDASISVSAVNAVQDAYLSFGSLKYFTKHGNIRALLSLAEDARWARGIGDFWSYHLLAQGKLDIMIEADTKLWDIAAMKVIIEEAGGIVTQLDGKPVNPGTTTLLATNGKLHDAVVKLFA